MGPIVGLLLGAVSVGLERGGSVLGVRSSSVGCVGSKAYRGTVGSGTACVAATVCTVGVPYAGTVSLQVPGTFVAVG